MHLNVMFLHIQYQYQTLKALPYKTKTPSSLEEGFLKYTCNRSNSFKKNRVVFWTTLSKEGGDILSHSNAVPSAQAGLTSLFGMGRGEPRRNIHLKRLNCFEQFLQLLRLFA